MERNLIDAELKNKKIKGYQKLKIKKTQKLICVTKTTTAQRRKLFFVKREQDYIVSNSPKVSMKIFAFIDSLKEQSLNTTSVRYPSDQKVLYF